MRLRDFEYEGGGHVAHEVCDPRLIDILRHAQRLRIGPRQAPLVIATQVRTLDSGEGDPENARLFAVG